MLYAKWWKIESVLIFLMLQIIKLWLFLLFVYSPYTSDLVYVAAYLEPCNCFSAHIQILLNPSLLLVAGYVVYAFECNIQ